MFYLKRLIHLAFIMLAVSFCAYMLIGLMPGDPIDILVAGNPYATAEDVARLKAAYGLDQSLIERYFLWLGNIVQGDWGYSRLYAEPVLGVIMPALKNSLILIGLSMALAITLALILGMLAARYKGGRIEFVINIFAFTGISVPSFWAAILAIFIFAVWLGWLPAGGMPPPGESAWTYYLLPVIILALGTLGHYIRYVRASMVEILQADFIKTAKAKGVSQIRLYFDHAFRNAAMPLITVVALDFGGLFSGALITETVFSINGMGKMLFDAIMGNDYNLAMMALMIATLAVLIGNLLADIIQLWLDPRLSAKGRAQEKEGMKKA